ncbi:MAG TPA: alpha/beta hydrolase-fold protein [Planctomycetota bacterium]|nr:alpha/beta hydrolase-fold protein [Planctomycetota bacterium]
MRTHLLSTLLTLAAATSLLAQNPPRGDRQRGGRREQAPVELKNFTFKEESFHSEAVGQDMPFGIYLPKGYDDDANKDKKWPLVIWLHGMFEDHMRFHNRGGAAVLDQTVGDGKLPPCVFVTANGGRTSMYVNRKDERWEDLITVDLLDHVTKNYRVSEQRNQRAIMGVSLGGMAALRIAFTKPELFGAVGVHSSAIFAEDPDQLPQNMKGMASRLGLDEVFGNPIQKEPWQKANPLCIASALDQKSLDGLRIYFDAGTDDRYGFAAGNKLLDEALTKKGIAHTWRLIEGGGHSWGAHFQDDTLPYSFAVVGSLFMGKDGDGKGANDAKKAAPDKH